MSADRPVLLAILDGWGISENNEGNAINRASTPHMDRWMKEYPCTTLVAHNGLVGLPEGQMGNSEVGHLNMGAGRIVYQDYTRINNAVETGELQQNPALNKVMDAVGREGSALHLFGLLSDGGVHSHIKHLLALLEMAKEKNLQKVFIHCFMDGRDTPPASGEVYIKQLQEGLQQIACGQIATVSGRYYAMDRDNRWDRVQKAWEAIVEGKGQIAVSGREAVAQSYAAGDNDEFIKPTVIIDSFGKPVARVEDNDALIFFNFRADRVRELCRAFIQTDFAGFSSPLRPAIMELVTFTEYDAEFDVPIAFPQVELRQILGEVLSNQRLRQLRIAETEKYAHVTYFFNGGEEEPYPGEDRIMVDSPRDVATYDEKPEMSANEVTDKLILAMEEAKEKANPYDVIVLNFANCDMVGHTGILEAAETACETVDTCIGRIQEYLKQHGGTLLVTADHGNAELMLDKENGETITAHSLSPVPFILVSEAHKQLTLKNGGALKDVAPTILALLGLEKPVEMEGESLLTC